MTRTFQRYPKVSKQCCSQTIAHTSLTPITLYKLTQSPFYAVFLLVDLTSKVPYFCRKCRGGKACKIFALLWQMVVRPSFLQVKLVSLKTRLNFIFEPYFFSMKHSSCWKVHNFLDARVSTKSSVFFKCWLRYVWGEKWVTRYLAILGLATGFLKPHRCMEQLF